jgi:hypothetical protein
MRRATWRLLGVGTTSLLVALASCRDETQIMRANTQHLRATLTPSAPGNIRPSRIRRPTEDPFVALANDEPSTAGFFLDAQGNLIVQTVDSSRLNNATNAASRRVANGDIALPKKYQNARIIARKAQYTFQQLSDWRDAVVDSVLGIGNGVSSVDLDEARNRVAIGILNDEPRGHTYAVTRLTQLGIPLAAVILERDNGTKPSYGTPVGRSASARRLVAHTLIDTTDTLGGGFEVGIQSGKLCTVGIVGDLSGTRGYVTASHCSDQTWNLDYSRSFQPDSTASVHRYLGHETVDPSGAACGLFQGCDYHRSSDGTWYTLDGSIPGRRGAIARPDPAYRTSGSAGGSTTIYTGGSPWLNVWATSSYYVGETLDKIGMASGWTYGTVSASCVDHDYLEGGLVYRVYCSGKASIWGHTGDSGAPVFIWDGAEGAIFIGLSYALDCSGSCMQDAVTYFTPFSSLETDLGTLNVVSEITVGTPSISGSINGGGNPVLSWSAVSTTNTSETTIYSIYRSVWDASTYTWTETNNLIGTTTSTSYTDGGNPLAVSSYQGATQPAECTYTFIAYAMRAYNAGIPAPTAPVYFQGAANGATPWQFTCP